MLTSTKRGLFEIDIDRTSCPCGSGKQTRCCCYRSNGKLVPSRAVTLIRSSDKGSNPLCYAAALGGCHGKIDREHYISDAIYRRIDAEGELNTFTCSNDGNSAMRRTTPKSEAARVLCQAHNNALSPLDGVGTRFFNAVADAHRDLCDEKSILEARKLSLFNGHDIERWALKALCGFISSGNAANQWGAKVKDWRPPLEWLQVIYGLGGMPTNFGMFAKATPSAGSAFGVGIIPLGIGESVYGARFQFNTIEFVIWMANPQHLKTIPETNGCCFRPGGYLFQAQGMKRAVVIEWEDDMPHQHISLGIGAKPAVPTAWRDAGEPCVST